MTYDFKRYIFPVMAAAALLIAGIVFVIYRYHSQSKIPQAIPPSPPTMKFGNIQNMCTGKGICGNAVAGSVNVIPNAIPVNLSALDDTTLVLSFSMNALKANQPDQVQYFSQPSYMFDFPYDISKNNKVVEAEYLFFPPGTIIATSSPSRVGIMDTMVYDTITVAHSQPANVNMIFGGFPLGRVFTAPSPSIAYISDSAIPPQNTLPKTPASIPVVLYYMPGDATRIILSFNWDTLVAYQSAQAATLGVTDANGALQFDISRHFYPYSRNIPLFANGTNYYTSSFASVLLPPNAMIPAYNQAAPNNQLGYNPQTRVVTDTIEYILLAP